MRQQKDDQFMSLSKLLIMDKIIEIQDLFWDSNFFNFKIGKVEIPDTFTSFSDLNSAFRTSDLDLIYLFAPPSIAIEKIHKEIDNIVLVDRKTTYSKPLMPFNINTDARITSVNELDEALINLAIQTGEFSRFNIDPNFKRDDYKKLYAEWIENSVKRQLAQEVLVLNEGQEKLGVITIGEKNQRADIGLVGVDSKARGKGVASALIAKAEQFAIDQNFKEIQVVTQGDNIAACSLYEKCGFTVESIVNVFHLWRIIK